MEKKSSEIAIYKMFKSSAYKDENMSYIFEDLFYPGDLIKSMIKDLLKNHYYLGTKKIIIFFNIPYKFDYSEENLESLSVFREIAKQFLYKDITLYNMDIEIKEEVE